MRSQEVIWSLGNGIWFFLMHILPIRLTDSFGCRIESVWDAHYGVAVKVTRCTGTYVFFSDFLKGNFSGNRSDSSKKFYNLEASSLCLKRWTVL